MVFGDQRLTDRSTASDRGHEQEVTLVIWAKGLGARAALEAAERIRVLLDDAALTLAGHRLVLLAVTRCELKRDERARAARVALTLRAVTEEL
ncbi:DUF3168 domain-containing protein [Chelatococcus sp. SYSU_G07232]|uniref:DUF3168 domain-containing protein n=1 Tax=Chelatococcus albus TaxID=3047466 RepID=A0ABT7AI46_9HYPH|nr:DUF3168 domain-containing protein [Chelatococcus sp. SYSU_G07232]MDJ1159028.1 DUF3168 domain-containing protein [Chelatococcus sp. SYSU_G07232]